MLITDAHSGDSTAARRPRSIPGGCCLKQRAYQVDLAVDQRLGPRSGNDTYDLIDDALATLAERCSVWLGDDLAAITPLASLIDQAGRCLPELVTNARLNGHTWAQIARALATSPSEARLRFDPESPAADSRWPYDI